MHYGDQVWNWIVQIKFGFKPSLVLCSVLTLVSAEVPSLKPYLKLDLIVTLNFALIRF